MPSGLEVIFTLSGKVGFVSEADVIENVDRNTIRTEAIETGKLKILFLNIV